MIPSVGALPRKSRLAALLEHFAIVEDPRDMRRISHRLDEILLLVVCGTIADWGAAHLDFLRRHLPCEHGAPGERWLTILMNRINPALFAAWVRDGWPPGCRPVASSRPGVGEIDNVRKGGGPPARHRLWPRGDAVSRAARRVQRRRSRR